MKTRFNPIDRPISPELAEMLPLSTQQVVGSSESTRKTIPANGVQEAMKQIGKWVSAAEALPAEGEIATLTFNDGHTEDVKVKEWDSECVGVEILAASGSSSVNSNIDTLAFINLLHQPTTSL